MVDDYLIELFHNFFHTYFSCIVHCIFLRKDCGVSHRYWRWNEELWFALALRCIFVCFCGIIRWWTLPFWGWQCGWLREVFSFNPPRNVWKNVLMVIFPCCFCRSWYQEDCQFYYDLKVYLSQSIHQLPSQVPSWYHC